MSVFIIRRLIQSSLVIAAMSVIVFFSVNVIGNPVDILINPEFDQEEMDRAIKALGLDLPIWQQYLHFVKNAFQGDFGRSFVFGESALKLIVQRVPATLELAFTALILSILIGIPLGLFAGLKPDSPVSKTIMGGSILGFSLPTFWVGIMMIMIFAVLLGVLPSTGRGETVTILGIRVSFLTLDGLKHLLMPAINLALLKISLVIRLTRAGTREVIHQDYVKFARAKGLSNRRIIFVHVLKNILIPVITVVGLELGNLIAFSVVTETVFAWPGMGKLIIDSIQLLDRPIIVAYLMIIVFMFVTINLVVDILYSVLDPRVRLQDIKA
ncbi:ABC transporter permease [Alkalispirochaeta odontotermitis]|nr:ABC transporter permease [Alkalispirochaeta odontotermitis]CAB1081139.1 ABC transporter, permease protein 1 (cluster 5, nickel/peptides/opines) [Olavius algarvensis Delta 1 endosymbiont]